MGHIKEFLRYVNLICDRGRSFSPLSTKKTKSRQNGGFFNGGSIDARLAW